MELLTLCVWPLTQYFKAQNPTLTCHFDVICVFTWEIVKLFFVYEVDLN